MIDFADTKSPFFCPCNFLLSVGIHLMADIGERSWEDSMVAADIVKLCYMEVMYERKYGQNSEQARLAALRRVVRVRLLRGPSFDSVSRGLFAL
jgi:hypothetical protein